jgi:hypothetical protein
VTMTKRRDIPYWRRHTVTAQQLHAMEFAKASEPTPQGERIADRAHSCVGKLKYKLIDQGYSATLVANVLLCEAFNLLMGADGELAGERETKRRQVERARNAFGYFIQQLDELSVKEEVNCKRKMLTQELKYAEEMLGREPTEQNIAWLRDVQARIASLNAIVRHEAA